MPVVSAAEQLASAEVDVYGKRLMSRCVCKPVTSKKPTTLGGAWACLRLQ